MYNFTEFWIGIQRMVRLYEKMMREVKLPEGCSLAENVVIKVRLEQVENKESE